MRVCLRAEIHLCVGAGSTDYYYIKLDIGFVPVAYEILELKRPNIRFYITRRRGLRVLPALCWQTGSADEKISNEIIREILITGAGGGTRTHTGTSPNRF